ncbi:MAG: hypothetical protein RPU41_14785 [Candidatus Sedimenticola sp. (ex Thyasira tokunagai)]
MDLEEFVNQTIIQIVKGTANSQSEVKELGGEVNPDLGASGDQLEKQGFLYSSEGPVQVVHFDVALTVMEGTGTKGGIGVFAGAVNLGSSGQSNNETSSVSHVKFSIPLRLPSSY